MILGSHEGVSGGLHSALERAKNDGADALQLFTKSGRQWKARELSAAEIASFKSAREALGGAAFPVATHASYLINLCATDDEILSRSREAFADELERCDLLGIDFLVVHPGVHGGAGDEEGLETIAVGLRKIVAQRPDRRVRILLEITAGQGLSVGCTFEHLRDLIDAIGSATVGVCFDTQHAFAGGYDLVQDYDGVWKRFGDTVGFDRLQAFHLNDSKKPLGCRVDRHEHIGKGAMGDAPFRRLMNDARFAAIPGFLETPPHDDGTDAFRENIALLRSFSEDAAITAKAPRTPIPDEAPRTARGKKRASTKA